MSKRLVLQSVTVFAVSTSFMYAAWKWNVTTPLHWLWMVGLPIALGLYYKKRAVDRAALSVFLTLVSLLGIILIVGLIEYGKIE